MTETFDASAAIIHLKTVTDQLSGDAKYDVDYLLCYLSNPEWWCKQHQTHASALLGSDAQ